MSLQIEHSSCVGLRPIPESAPEWARKAILEARMRNGGEIRISPSEQRRMKAERNELRHILLEGFGPQGEPLPIVTRSAVRTELGPQGEPLPALVDDYAARARRSLDAAGLLF